jgi:preprotein translocase subunit Sec61beta
MAQQNQGINLPGGFGGLMRYSEEYSSLINLKPTHVIVFIILIIGLRVLLPMLIKLPPV